RKERLFFVCSSAARHKRQHAASVFRKLSEDLGLHRLAGPPQLGPESRQRALPLGVITVLRAQVSFDDCFPTRAGLRVLSNLGKVIGISWKASRRASISSSSLLRKCL